MRNYFLFIPVLLFIACKTTKEVSVDAGTHSIAHYGRTVIDQNNNLVLIGSASYAAFNFTGDSCTLMLQNRAQGDDYNYVSIELDNVYMGRLKIAEHIPSPYVIKAIQKSASHTLRVYKATESQNGQVVLTGIKGINIKPAPHSATKMIEFIGNSITCGMGNDTKDIPCGTGKWYDQHNSYWAYGPRIARTLNADFMLSSVSGIGIYRNWNSDGPAMPEVYESAFLEMDSLQRWNFQTYTPDVVSICLGTNDFSDGDGKHERLPFDSATFIQHYINFINTVYKHYPKTQIALLTSPMLSGAKYDLLYACLVSIKTKLTGKHLGVPPIEIFRFQPMMPKGCSYHPDMNDHEVMAIELLPFFKRLLSK